MLIFSVFTLGYFIGVFTALAVFPPNTREIEEQELDTLQPILDLEKEKELEREIKDEGVYSHPAIIPS